MAIVINGSGTVTGLAVGGLPDGTVDAGTVAADVATQAELDAKTDATKVPLAGGTMTGNLIVGSVTDPTISLLSNANDNATSGRLKFREGDGVNGFDLRYNGSANQAVIDTTDVSNAIVINRTDGAVTMPNQPAFLVNARHSAPTIAPNTNTTAEFTLEVYDVNADYNTSTYTFTAPVTGKYQLNCSLLWINWDSSASYYYLQIVTSNRTYYQLFSGGASSSDITYFNGNIHVLADMDANDTAYVRFYQASGAQQTYYENQSIFGGFLAC